MLLLVGSHTGVGQFLSNPRQVPEQLGMPAVVPGRSDDVPLWADRAQQVLADLPSARRDVDALRAYLVSTFTWEEKQA